MPDLRKTRRSLTIAIAAMVVADIVAAGILFSPLVGSADSRRAQIRQLTADLARKTHDVQPLHDMPKKMDLAKSQIGDFYKGRFAARDSELTTELGRLASENGVRIQQARYKEEDPEASGIVPVQIEGSFSGDYLQLVRFINTLERSKMFFTVDSVDLAGEGAGPVRLQIGLHSYLRGA
ncbi:MAG TPA: GspMb/PilO family protein [Terriglobales bacterium]|nr:GspMb/PilO family protein [Terriglobales bacterium]